MADGLELVQALEATMAEQQRLVDSLTPLMVAKAQTEYEYRVAKAERMERLREDGYPASVLADIAKGDRLVAAKARSRDEARDRYWNRQKELEMRRDEADDIRAQIQRDYSMAGWRQ